MHLIIDIETINDHSQREWLFNTLRRMNIGFITAEKRQTLEEYNLDIDEAESEIEKGNYTLAETLKGEASKW